ncbi:MAG TPA: ATP-binding protein [Candidatus Binataceae bacterium]|nr:ATP-binding protein [Candidatus Binataceae bacterium]
MLDEDDPGLQRLSEQKRRRRELIAVAVAGVLLGAFALAQVTLPPLTSHTSLLSNLAVILLFDLSFLLLGLLLFLVGRNIAKVFFERQRGLIGSKLQARLVIGFIAVAMLPSGFLLYVSESFLRADIDSWFNPEYKKVLDDSLDNAKSYYLDSANDALHFARVLAGNIGSRDLMGPQRRPDLKKFVEQKQQEYRLGTIEVFSPDRKLLVLALSPQIPTGIGVSPHSGLLIRTLAGHPTSRTDSFGRSDVIRGTAPIFASPESDKVLGAVVVDYFVPRSLAKRAAKVSESFEDYVQLRALKQPIMRNYLLALLMIGLVVVLLASWFGIFLARGITGPIKLLAEGTHAVAAGDLSHEIPTVSDDEIGHLVTSFNQMTADLRTTNAELEQRRRYTETLLRNVSAGVVALDRSGRITTINPCAERLLGLDAHDVQGRHYAVTFPPPLAGELARLFDGGLPPEGGTRSVTLDERSGSELMVTASPLSEEGQNQLGSVLFFEDVSQIAKIERMEAWREVARRIAHEIKNPLTPIQLSAERIRRHPAGAGSSLIDECTRTIVSEVEDLKHLVDEFSMFARMPHLNPMPGDLNGLAEETVANFRGANGEIEFVTDLDPALPTVAIDREALKRALVNLLDNAVAAINGAPRNGGGPPRIEVRTRLDRASGVVTLEVSDNGPGIDPALKSRIFEPYFSTKVQGTGLGLAIVSTIVSDHHGFVRVRDNEPRGSRFVLEFPVKEQQIARILS